MALPLSSVFIPDGYKKAFSELGFEEKVEVNDRSKLAASIMAFLRKY